MWILFFVISVVFILVIYGNSKRVERGEITHEQSQKLTVGNTTKGLIAGGQEVRRHNNEWSHELEVKKLVSKYGSVTTQLDLIDSMVRMDKTKREYFLSGEERMNQRDKKEFSELLQVSYADCIDAIDTLPKEKQMPLISKLKQYELARERAIKKLVETLADQEYLANFYELYGSSKNQDLFRLLSVENKKR